MVYLYCSCDRDYVFPKLKQFDQIQFKDRFTGIEFLLSIEQSKCFCELFVANELELVFRSKDFYQKRLYGGEDIGVFVVSTETWNNKITSYDFDEYVYLINGQSIVKPKEENSKVLYSGDHLFVPKGFEGEWEIRAGNNLHYELAVINTQRADSTKILKETNYEDFNRSVLSGCQISFKENNSYKELLHKGIELTITLEAEKPKESLISFPMKEKLVHVLSGKLTITDSADEEYIFCTGDFFVIPKGLRGKWKSEGHEMIKYMTIEKTE